jgi:hypothetical protein
VETLVFGGIKVETPIVIHIMWCSLAKLKWLTGRRPCRRNTMNRGRNSLLLGLAAEKTVPKASELCLPDPIEATSSVRPSLLDLVWMVMQDCANDLEIIPLEIKELGECRRQRSWKWC